LYFLRGGFLDGRAGLIYALQRAYAELLLVLMLDDSRKRQVDLPTAALSSGEPLTNRLPDKAGSRT
jgi:hypothetical protein